MGKQKKAEEGCAGAGAGLDEGREIGWCEFGMRMLVVVGMGAGAVICAVLVVRVILALLRGDGLWIQCYVQ